MLISPIPLHTLLRIGFHIFQLYIEMVKPLLKIHCRNFSFFDPLKLAFLLETHIIILFLCLFVFHCTWNNILLTRKLAPKNLQIVGKNPRRNYLLSKISSFQQGFIASREYIMSIFSSYLASWYLSFFLDILPIYLIYGYHTIYLAL